MELSPRQAWTTVLGLLALSVLAFVMPWQFLVVGVIGSLAAMRKGRLGFAIFIVTTIVFNVVLMAWLHPSPKDWFLGPVGLGMEGAWIGVVAALRISVILGINLATLQAIPPAALLEGLRLPRPAYAFLAAVLITSQDIGRDFARLRDARRLEGGWPEKRVARAKAAAQILPLLLAQALRRGETRREALHMAGHETHPNFGPIVAITALAVAGRLALIAVPNVALTFVVVFLGGLLYGWRVGFWAGLWSMLLTNLVLSGFFLPAYANVLGMAIVGMLGGALRGFDWNGGKPIDRMAGLAFAAATGVIATLLFSITTDAATWLLVPELRAAPDRLRFDILAGLAFNVVPAIVNGVLFAASVQPVHRAVQATRPQGSPSA